MLSWNVIIISIFSYSCSVFEVKKRHLDVKYGVPMLKYFLRQKTTKTFFHTQGHYQRKKIRYQETSWKLFNLVKLNLLQTWLIPKVRSYHDKKKQFSYLMKTTTTLSCISKSHDKCHFRNSFYIFNNFYNVFLLFMSPVSNFLQHNVNPFRADHY
jgi:hypothetical protein